MIGKQKLIAFFALFIVGIFILVSCGDDVPVPKPRAYSRVSYPERDTMQQFTGDCPFTFQYPAYAELRNDMVSDAQRCWYNIHYAPFNADLHLSYKPILLENDLRFLLRDAYTFVDKHQQKASKISEQVIRGKQGMGGLLWRIGGNTASSIQFFVTDSVQHFMRGSLYFMAKPNQDSLKPIIDFLEQDIVKTIESIRWKYRGVETSVSSGS